MMVLRKCSFCLFVIILFILMINFLIFYNFFNFNKVGFISGILVMWLLILISNMYCLKLYLKING